MALFQTHDTDHYKRHTNEWMNAKKKKKPATATAKNDRPWPWWCEQEPTHSQICVEINDWNERNSNRHCEQLNAETGTIDCGKLNAALLMHTLYQNVSCRKLHTGMQKNDWNACTIWRLSRIQTFILWFLLLFFAVFFYFDFDFYFLQQRLATASERIVSRQMRCFGVTDFSGCLSIHWAHQWRHRL